MGAVSSYEIHAVDDTNAAVSLRYRRERARLPDSLSDVKATKLMMRKNVTEEVKLFVGYLTGTFLLRAHGCRVVGHRDLWLDGSRLLRGCFYDEFALSLALGCMSENVLVLKFENFRPSSWLFWQPFFCDAMCNNRGLVLLNFTRCEMNQKSTMSLLKSAIVTCVSLEGLWIEECTVWSSPTSGSGIEFVTTGVVAGGLKELFLKNMLFTTNELRMIAAMLKREDCCLTTFVLSSKVEDRVVARIPYSILWKIVAENQLDVMELSYGYCFSNDCEHLAAQLKNNRTLIEFRFLNCLSVRDVSLCFRETLLVHDNLESVKLMNEQSSMADVMRLDAYRKENKSKKREIVQILKGELVVPRRLWADGLAHFQCKPGFVYNILVKFHEEIIPIV